MSGFKIGCQTITWGENQKEDFPGVFSEIASAGFSGVEIGFRHIRSIPPQDLKKMLDQYEMTLAASHIGGNLLDTAQAEGEHRIIDETLAYLRATETKILMYSGLRYKDDTQFSKDFGMLNLAAEECKKQGIKLLYHNHNWEFADGAVVSKALLNNASDALGFCPDVGWVMKGGVDTIKFLEAAKDKIGAVHFKDFATKDPGVDTVLLGDGVAPLKEAAEWVRNNMQGLWIIAEQDKADVPTSEVAVKNATYLKRLFGVQEG
jgi:sugar phosphate isomerase/epimerase